MEETQDRYRKAVNKVIDYINDHLYEQPSVVALSRIAGISGFHFHRIFKAIIGENIGEYTTRLRLEDIAQRLRMDHETLEDLSIHTGYASKHALSKAFKNHFGVAPSIYRKQLQDISYFSTNKAFSMKRLPLFVEVRKEQTKNIVYLRIIDTYGSHDTCNAAWSKLMHFGNERQLIHAKTEYFGLAFDDPTITPTNQCRFYVCFSTPQKIKSEGAFGVGEIKGGLYVIFLHKGSYRELINSYHYIYMQWLPQSTYKFRSTYCVEKYLNHPSEVLEDELLTEIYVPITNR